MANSCQSVAVLMTWHKTSLSMAFSRQCKLQSSGADVFINRCEPSCSWMSSGSPPVSGWMKCSSYDAVMIRLQRMMPPKMPFFVRQKVQISSKILPNIPNFHQISPSKNQTFLAVHNCNCC